MSSALGSLAALAGFDLMTAGRLRALLAHHDPDEAFAVAAGQATAAPVVAEMLTVQDRAAWKAWRRGAHRPSGPTLQRVRHSAVCIRVETFPAGLRHDPDPPTVLFVRGDLDLLDGGRAGVVGTRNATQSGREIAASLGRGLAEAGVAVVSGFAKGIDGAAHRGVLRQSDGRAIAVVGNGTDKRYPVSTPPCGRGVWARAAVVGVAAGHVAGAVPLPDAQPHPRRACEVVVVVESRERRGSLITARAALDATSR